MIKADRREPVFNIPGIVLGMLAVMAAVHLLRLLLGEAADADLVLALAFIPDRYSAQPLEWPGGWLSAWTSPVTYMAVHGDLTHLIFNAASLLAFGGVVAQRLGNLRFAGFTIVCGVAGALLFLLLNPGMRSPLIGASGAISGIMAAALRLLLSAIASAPEGMAGEWIRRVPQVIPLKSLAQAAQDRTLQLATGSWLLINVLAAYGLATPAQAGVVAWEAHVGGYFAGLILFGLFDPPSRVRLKNMGGTQQQNTD